MATKIVHPETPFDPKAGLPAALQSRFETWKRCPPRSQFQQYGPLNAYLQGHKFSSEIFLVKPQALLRCLASDVQIAAHSKRTQEPTENKSQGRKRPRYSIDSHGEVVTKKRLYPDFDIDQYYSFAGDKNLTCDIVRVVIEVGSLSNYKKLKDAQSATAVNLRRYLMQVGNRAHGRLLGIGIVGNTVLLKHINSDGWMKRGMDIDVRTNDWFSLFDPKLFQALDDMVKFCEDDKPFDDWDEECFRCFTGLVTERGSDGEEDGDDEDGEEDDNEYENEYENEDNEDENEDNEDENEDNEDENEDYGVGNDGYFEDSDIQMSE